MFVYYLTFLNGLDDAALLQVLLLDR